MALCESPVIFMLPKTGNNHPSFVYHTPAKLNLRLKITGLREDGYHELVSIMVPVGLYDRIELEPVTENAARMHCNGFSVPDDESNLVFKAIRAFSSCTGMDQGFLIHLTKNIPVAAGLGGGSSDAACVLMALNEMFSNPVSEEKLAQLAVGLGADVPFFLYGGPCLARGIGEILELIQEWPNLWYVVVMPPIAVSTAWVYTEFDKYHLRSTEKNTGELELTKAQYPFIMPDFRGEKYQIEPLLENDLEKITIPAFPVIDTIKTLLLQAGAGGALMSGSGPSVFGVFQSKEKCFQAKEFLQARNVGDVFALEGLMGCRQAVRHGPLEPAFGGSNPPTPANERTY